MIKSIFKKWYLIPLIIYVLSVLFSFAIFSYISPIHLEEGPNKRWLVKSKSYKLEITCIYVGGPDEACEYAIKSVTHSHYLDERWISLTDLFYSSPVGMIFGNFDFDDEEELLILGCEGLYNTQIPHLGENIKKYFYPNLSYMGYYDFENGRFIFKPIQDSPFYQVIKNEYIDGALGVSEIWIFCFQVFLTMILMLLNYLLSKFIRYLRNKKTDGSEKADG